MVDVCTDDFLRTKISWKHRLLCARELCYKPPTQLLTLFILNTNFTLNFYKFLPLFQHRYLFTGRYLSVIKMDEVDQDAATKEEQDLKTTVNRECATVDNELNTNGMISD